MERPERRPIGGETLPPGFHPSVAVPPRAVVAAAEVDCRCRVRGALLPIGWELAEVDDAWQLLDYLGGTLLGTTHGCGPDLVLFDVRLPGPEWPRILVAVQGLCPSVPVVLICAAGTGSAVGPGVVGVLHEPLRSDRIVAAVNAALRVG